MAAEHDDQALVNVVDERAQAKTPHIDGDATSKTSEESDLFKNYSAAELANMRQERSFLQAQIQTLRAEGEAKLQALKDKLEAHDKLPLRDKLQRLDSKAYLEERRRLRNPHDDVSSVSSNKKVSDTIDRETAIQRTLDNVEQIEAISLEQGNKYYPNKLTPEELRNVVRSRTFSSSSTDADKKLLLEASVTANNVSASYPDYVMASISGRLMSQDAISMYPYVFGSLNDELRRTGATSRDELVYLLGDDNASEHLGFMDIFELGTLGGEQVESQEKVLPLTISDDFVTQDFKIMHGAFCKVHNKVEVSKLALTVMHQWALVNSEFVKVLTSHLKIMAAMGNSIAAGHVHELEAIKKKGLHIYNTSEIPTFMTSLAMRAGLPVSSASQVFKMVMSCSKNKDLAILDAARILWAWLMAPDKSALANFNDLYVQQKRLLDCEKGCPLASEYHVVRMFLAQLQEFRFKPGSESVVRDIIAEDQLNKQNGAPTKLNDLKEMLIKYTSLGHLEPPPTRLVEQLHSLDSERERKKLLKNLKQSPMKYVREEPRQAYRAAASRAAASRAASLEEEGGEDEDDSLSSANKYETSSENSAYSSKSKKSESMREKSLMHHVDSDKKNDFNKLSHKVVQGVEAEASELGKVLFREIVYPSDWGGGTGVAAAFIPADQFNGINQRIRTLSPQLQSNWNKFKAACSGKDPLYGDLIRKAATVKKANVGVSLSGRSFTSPAAACASASSQPFSFDYKMLAKEVVSQMGSVTEEMSGKMAKEVTSRLEKHWGPGNVDGSDDDDEPVGSDDDDGGVDDDDDEFVPGSGGGGKYYTDKDLAPGSGRGGKYA